ncbi:unnamed protein product, partial [Chrysoparadoxa australica]
RVPAQTLKVGNIKIGIAVHNLRMKRKNGGMKEEEERWWTANGMVWDVDEYNWQVRYHLFLTLPVIDGHRSLPQGATVDGIKIGRWIDKQRHKQKKGDLKVKRKELLDLAKMKWHCVEIKDEEKMEALLEWAGHESIPYCAVHKFEDGRVWKIGRFFAKQKHAKKNRVTGKKRKK